MNVTRAVLLIFREQKEGMILNAASLAAAFGFVWWARSTSRQSSRSRAFTGAFVYELASQNIVVSTELAAVTQPSTPRRRTKKKKNTGDGVKELRSVSSKPTPFFALIKGIAAPEKIADVIYKCSTDVTKRFRYMAVTIAKHFDARRRWAARNYENAPRLAADIACEFVRRQELWTQIQKIRFCDIQSNKLTIVWFWLLKTRV